MESSIEQVWKVASSILPGSLTPGVHSLVSFSLSFQKDWTL